MIVWCCGMSRSGGTVQYQITKSLVELAEQGRGMGQRFQPVLQRPRGKQWFVVKREQSEPGKVLRSAAGDQSKVVGIYRDPRAVASSLYTWRGAQGRDPSLAETWKETKLALRWFKAWTPHLDYVVSYEEAIKDWGAVAIGINDALALGLSDEECRGVVEEWAVIENKKRMAEQDRWMDPDTLLTRNHITGGGALWIDILPVSLVAGIELYYRDWMEAHGYDCILGSTPEQIYQGSPGLCPECTEA